MKMGHLMQPFDQKFFPKHKDYWRSKHGDGAKDPEQEKENFFRNFCNSRSVDLDSDAIKGAFAGQGLSPFDPSKILERLK